MTEPSFAARVVRCPTCGGDSIYAVSNPFRPFCSARCKNHDFGAWASEAFRVEEKPVARDPALGEDADDEAA
jgi:endogenous inhibitor of DNA gyrase (YacG/DUF329 family)